MFQIQKDFLYLHFEHWQNEKHCSQKHGCASLQFLPINILKGSKRSTSCYFSVTQKKIKDNKKTYVKSYIRDESFYFIHVYVSSLILLVRFWKFLLRVIVNINLILKIYRFTFINFHLKNLKIFKHVEDFFQNMNAFF